MTTSCKATDELTIPGNNENSITSTTTTPLGHRRQASHGLEINTSKNNTFFETNNKDIAPTPRPPPSISRKISMHNPKHISQQSSPTFSPSPIPNIIKPCSRDNSDDELYHHDNSYASRLRNLVAGNTPTARQSPTMSISRKVNPYSPQTPSVAILENEVYQEEVALTSLPTPHPTTSKTKKEEGRHFLFPTVTVEDRIIPVVSTDFDSTLLSTMPQETAEGTEHLHQHISSDIVGKQIGQYQVRKLLGIGAFSKVYLANRIETDMFFAIKAIKKGKLLNDARIRSSIEREVSILKMFDYPNIVHLETTMETETMMCIVLEYVEGGELFDFVTQMHTELRATQHFEENENQAKKLFLQLVRAVKWLHQHNIVHRDLKLENILIHKQGKNEPVLKITDFGLARIIEPDNPLLTTRCGSEEYAAPEIIQHTTGYDGRKTDTWALGIILYSLLVGYLPFRYDPRKSERVSKLFYRIIKAEVKWPQDIIISDQAKQVVTLILERNPEKRILIDDIEQLSWFQ